MRLWRLDSRDCLYWAQHVRRQTLSVSKSSASLALITPIPVEPSLLERFLPYEFFAREHEILLVE
jgi:hypothetical protein